MPKREGNEGREGRERWRASTLDLTCPTTARQAQASGWLLGSHSIRGRYPVLSIVAVSFSLRLADSFLQMPRGAAEHLMTTNPSARKIQKSLSLYVRYIFRTGLTCTYRTRTMCGELHPRLGLKSNLGCCPFGHRYIPYFCFLVPNLSSSQPVVTDDNTPCAPCVSEILEYKPISCSMGRMLITGR